MSRRPEKRLWRVVTRLFALQVPARTAGGAARQAFRLAIAKGWLDRQPETDTDGGWKGVSIEPIPGTRRPTRCRPGWQNSGGTAAA